MKDLLKNITKAWSKDLETLSMSKLVVADNLNIKGGESVEIVWSDDLIDTGYVMVLPIQTVDENDYIVHIPQQRNVRGMDNGDSVWIHILNLIDIDRVKRVRIYN